MLGLDTNVLVRWLVGDEDSPEQMAAIHAALHGATGELFVNTVVLVETTWVLERHFRFARPDIATTIAEILGHRWVRVADRDAAETALAAYRMGGGDFADHLIGALNEMAGCSTTLTFDKRAARGASFTALT